jgi:3-hydroxyisobutyrate dehydrogenase
LKDLKLAQEAAAAAGAVTPLGAEAAQIYGLFCAQQGNAALDFSGVIGLFQERKPA